MTISASIIIVTKDISEDLRPMFEHSLRSLKDFEDVWVVHSGKDHALQTFAKKHRAHYISYQWDGQYPKKRQYCLDTIPTKYKWVFFLDADEVMLPELAQEIDNILHMTDINHYGGFFIKGGYIWKGKPLKYGLKNNKLCLLHKDRMVFPVIDDLKCESMGEIEGHYQPTLKASHYKIGQLTTILDHYAFADMKEWDTRHQKYALWEAYMIQNKAYPQDPSFIRQTIKSLFRSLPCRPLCAFLHSYLLKKGVLDGRAGFHFAKTRYHYYKMVNQLLKTKKERDKPVALSN